MIQLKHCLLATAGLVIVITAVARLNALNAGGQRPPGHDAGVVGDDPQRVFEAANGSITPHGSVHALFDLSAPVTGPFPSDWFTVADTSHNTGRRVSLPLPDCATRHSDCENVAVLNSLDGFNLQPRLSVPFSGSIDANSVTSDTVFLVSLGSTLSDQGYMPPGTVVAGNPAKYLRHTT